MTQNIILLELEEDSDNNEFILKNKDEIKIDKENNYIEFNNLQFFGLFNKNVTLIVSSPLILFEDKKTNKISNSIKFKINIHFRPCNQFEIITKTDFSLN